VPVVTSIAWAQEFVVRWKELAH